MTMGRQGRTALSFIRKTLLLAAAATLIAAGTANATTITFYQLTANTSTAVAAQLTVDVTDPGNGTVDFTFYNNVGITSSLTDIYFADGTLLAIASISDSGGGVNFAALADPDELPGAATASPAFVTTQNFSADSFNSGQGSTVHQSG